MRDFHRTAVRSGLAIFLTATVLSSPAISRPHREYRVVTLDAGTVIPVKLNQSLNSKEAQRGDTFTATVTADNGNAGMNGLPKGTVVNGVVRKAQPKKGKEPGTLDLTFNRITLPNGRSYSIDGSPIGLDDKSVTHRGGRLIAKPGHKGPNRLTYVGIGAGAGLLVNVLGHRKGTLTDMLIGAAAGYGIGSLIKNPSATRDVDLKSGTRLGVCLNRSLALSH